MSKVIYYAAIMFYHPRRSSKRGWPRVLYWRQIPSTRYEEIEKFLENFYLDTGVNDVPMEYRIGIFMKDTRPYKAQAPERILKQRLNKLDKKAKEQFPLFAEQFKKSELEKNPKKFDLGVIKQEQEERQKLADGVDPEVSLPKKMSGNDSWKRRNWKKINERHRRLLFSKPKKISRELIEGMMVKERGR